MVYVKWHKNTWFSKRFLVFFAHLNILASNISFDNEKNMMSLLSQLSPVQNMEHVNKSNLSRTPTCELVDELCDTLFEFLLRQWLHILRLMSSNPATENETRNIKRLILKSFTIIYLWRVRCAASAVTTADLSEGFCTVKADIFLIQFFLMSVTWSRMAS